MLKLFHFHINCKQQEAFYVLRKIGILQKGSGVFYVKAKPFRQLNKLDCK